MEDYRFVDNRRIRYIIASKNNSGETIYIKERCPPFHYVSIIKPCELDEATPYSEYEYAKSMIDDIQKFYFDGISDYKMELTDSIYPSELYVQKFLIEEYTAYTEIR